MTYNLKDLLIVVQVIIIIFFDEYNLLYISVGLFQSAFVSIDGL